jgi:hypothetical protein
MFLSKASTGLVLVLWGELITGRGPRCSETVLMFPS